MEFFQCYNLHSHFISPKKFLCPVKPTFFFTLLPFSSFVFKDFFPDSNTWVTQKEHVHRIRISAFFDDHWTLAKCVGIWIYLWFKGIRSQPILNFSQFIICLQQFFSLVSYYFMLCLLFHFIPSFGPVLIIHFKRLFKLLCGKLKWTEICVLKSSFPPLLSLSLQLWYSVMVVHFLMQNIWKTLYFRTTHK